MSAESGTKTYIVPVGFNVNKWFLKTDLSTGAKLTYLILASCCGGRDYVWPSQEYLAENTSTSKRTVRRYLDELVKAEFIEVAYEVLMGQRRAIYRFLNHAVLSFEKVKKAGKRTPPLHFDELREESLSGTEKDLPSSSACDAKMARQEDKNDSALNKVESYEDNIRNTPLPPKKEVLKKDQNGKVENNSSGKEGVNFQPEGEIFQQDDPAWQKAKSLLADRLSQFDLKAYIEPIFFERKESRAVLRVPNSFFLSQVKKNFADELTHAFKEAGFDALLFEEMTPEQKEAARHLQAKKEAFERVKTIQVTDRVKAEEELDFGAVPLDTLYEKLYREYLRREAAQKGLKLFVLLARGNQLPSMKILLTAVRRQKIVTPPGSMITVVMCHNFIAGWLSSAGRIKNMAGAKKPLKKDRLAYSFWPVKIVLKNFRRKDMTSWLSTPN